MKQRAWITLCALWMVAVLLRAQAPAWVQTHPVSEEAYVGVGMAPLSEADYVRKATQNALADMATQIALKVDDQSFLHTVDVDGHSRQLFEDKIKNSLTAWIEGHELVDSYRSDRNYYVYYRLSKKNYALKVEERRRQVSERGYEYLSQGQDAESSMDLTRAVQLYAKGLEVVEPWTFLNLEVNRNGAPVRVADKLYTSLIGVFSGMAITTNVQEVEGEPFKPIASPIAGCLSRRGEVVSGITLSARFVKGKGEITPPVATDHTGTAEFYITNITAKEGVQEVRIAIDESCLATLPKSYRALMSHQSWPEAKVTVTLGTQPVLAYLYVKEDHDLEGCERNIGSLLTNNYFSMTDDPDAALCFIEMESSVEIGTTIPGAAYDLNPCYCTLTLKFYNNKTEQLLLNYSLNRIKVLTPVTKSAEESIAMCIREVMKRVNRELPVKLKKLSF